MNIYNLLIAKNVVGGGGGSEPINPKRTVTIIDTQSFTPFDGKGVYVGEVDSNYEVYPEEITAIFDGVTYTCPREGSGGYGAPWDYEEEAYDFSEYPFNVQMDTPKAYILVANSNEHTISVIGDIDIPYVSLQALEDMPDLQMKTGEIKLVEKAVATPYIIAGDAQIYGSPKTEGEVTITFADGGVSIDKTYDEIYPLITGNGLFLKGTLVGDNENDPTEKKVVYLTLEFGYNTDNIVMSTAMWLDYNEEAHVFTLTPEDELSVDYSTLVVPSRTEQDATSIYPRNVVYNKEILLLPRLKPVTVINNTGYSIYMYTVDAAGNTGFFETLNNNAQTTSYLPYDASNGRRFKGAICFSWKTIPATYLALTASSSDGECLVYDMTNPNDNTHKNPYRFLCFWSSANKDSATVTLFVDNGGEE